VDIVIFYPDNTELKLLINMDFFIKGFKKQEFQSILLSMMKEINIIAGQILQFDNDGPDTIVRVNDSIIRKLSQEQLAQLKEI
jgi:hypothetical protein